MPVSPTPDALNTPFLPWVPFLTQNVDILTTPVGTYTRTTERGVVEIYFFPLSTCFELGSPESTTFVVSRSSNGRQRRFLLAELDVEVLRHLGPRLERADISMSIC